VEWLDWVPVDKEPFTSKGLRETTIIRKAELINEGYIFLAGSTIIPNNYYLGCDYNQIKCIHVEEWVASFIRETGLKEVIGIKPTTEPQQMINLTPLMLTLTFSDESTRICMLPDAVISNQFGEVFIYAPSEGKIQEVFDEYWEDVADHSGDNDIHDQETDLRDRLAEEMADFFGVLSQSRFDFLPHFYQLKSLTFEHGNLACKYEDGTTKQYILRRDS
jgi:hypothetical protein